MAVTNYNGGMPIQVTQPELLGRSDSSLTLSFQVQDETGRHVDSAARILLNGDLHATVDPSTPTRLVRIEGLAPGSNYTLEIEGEHGERALHDEFFPHEAETLPAPTAREAATFASLNDVHFGEKKIGGVLTEDKEYGDEAPGFPVIRADDTAIPYPRFMNTDAVTQINALGVDAAIVKGDIADRGLPEQFQEAGECFGNFEMPYHALLGNHDYLGEKAGHPADGYALLGQEPAPRRIEIGGWHLLLLETALPGQHHGVFGRDRLDWLEAALSESSATGAPTLLVMHHQPVPRSHGDSYPNSIGLRPEDSELFFEMVGQHAVIRAVLIGHTHRNRVRLYPASGDVPFAETTNTKDYPGTFAHYRLFEDGSLHQEVRRIESPRALEHSTRCRGLFRGLYRNFTMGSLADRSFAVPALA
ncbi:MAG: metallophosphoesterase [Myxococcota bacterium]|nr:metallophosphoesterase [Myxococcota bacterium]